MRLIDADELKKNFQAELCNGIACAECSMQAEGFCRVERWIDIAPTIDAEPYCSRINPYSGMRVEDEDFCSWGEKNG